MTGKLKLQTLRVTREELNLLALRLRDTVTAPGVEHEAYVTLLRKVHAAMRPNHVSKSADALDAERWRQLSPMWDASLNRRATVENWMFEAAAGKRPMPTPAELREWANKLGVPDELRGEFKK